MKNKPLETHITESLAVSVRTKTLVNVSKVLYISCPIVQILHGRGSLPVNQSTVLTQSDHEEYKSENVHVCSEI